MRALPSHQKGSALALVMWMLTALSVVVAGAVSMSREEVRLSSGAMFSAKAFYLGKGVALLAMFERAQMAQASSGDNEFENRSAVFSKRYTLGGAVVDAKVIPASGFVSLRGSDDKTWETLLTKIGGLDVSTAEQVIKKLPSTVGGGALPGNVTGFAAYRFKYGGGGGHTRHIESLLSLEGMTRDAYDRIYPNISPVPGPSTPNLMFAPKEISAVFEDASESEAPSRGGSGGAFCVQVEMDFGSGDEFAQRIWVSNRGAASGALEFVRIEPPVRMNRSGGAG